MSYLYCCHWEMKEDLVTYDLHDYRTFTLFSAFIMSVIHLCHFEL